MHACNIWIILKNLHCLSEIQITLSSCILSSNLIHTSTPGTFPASLTYPFSFAALKINISFQLLKWITFIYQELKMETSDKEKELCKGKRGNEGQCMELTQFKPWGWFTVVLLNHDCMLGLRRILKLGSSLDVGNFLSSSEKSS